MVLREQNDPLNQSRGIMGPLENSGGVQNNRGRLRQRFDLIRKLGQGTYGKVQLGIDKETGQEVAIKTIKKSKIETDADLIRIRREIQIMSSVRHPNIIHIYEVFENREKMVLVMEYAAGGELYDYLNERKILQEDEARRIFRQVASAVYYCHKHKICHRDLKLENILLDEKSNAKIADFGLSNVFDDTHLLKTFCGSPLYASPEIVRGTPYYGPEVDCWSLGVLLYTLVYGAMPFDGSNFKRLVKQISNGDYYEPKQTAQASALIRHMLTVNPVKRATIKDVCDSEWLNHGFDEQCLAIAEGLANQTPVRLDLLLSLTPNSAINHDNMIIEKAAEPSPSSSKTKTKSEQEPVKKKAKQDAKVKTAVDSKTPSKTPTDVKRKQVVKKKSQSSPLLELIVDVEEENDMGAEEDDAGDTLSEISEIQTIAEDNGEIKARTSKAKLEPAAPKPKEVEKVKVEPAPPVVVAVKPKAKVEPPKEQLQKPVEKVERKSPAKVVEPELKPPALVASKAQKEPSPSKSEKPVKDEPGKPVKVEPTKPEPVKPVKVEPVKVEPPKPEPAKAVKVEPESKPVPATKVEEPAKPATKVEEPAKPAAQVPTPVPEPVSEKAKESEPVKKLVKKKVVKPKPAADGVKDTESSSDTSKVEPKPVVSPQVKARSDSLTGENTSPTRIERRSSKVISQKTAELIQNLETKASTDGPKGKKLVFPSLKVSDAKSRFENQSSPETNGPLKPVLRSQLSMEKKALEVKPTPVKSKSPSPKPAQPPVPTVSDQKDKAAEEVKVEAKPKATPATKPTVEPTTPKPSETKEKPAVATTANDTNPKVPEPSVQAKVPGKIVPDTKPAPVPAAPKREEGPKPFPKPAGELQPAPPKPAPVPVPKQLPKLKMPEETKAPLVPTASVDTATPLSTMDSAATTGVSSTDGFFTDTTESVPKVSKAFGKPQNKEQAAKKIGSVIHRIVSSESVPKLNRQDSSTESAKTKRSEVSFPVSSTVSKERVIPIKLIDENVNDVANSSKNSSAANVPRLPPSMKSNSSVYSRQNSSDTESSVATAPPLRNDPIKKSPREFIIPIKMEASGHTVMPKEEVLNSEASTSEDNFRVDGRLRSGRFGKQRRYSSLLSDSSFEDEPLSASVSASTSRRSSAAGASHARSLSQGDEPTASTSGTFKRPSRMSVSSQLDRSDSFSSAEEDEEDAFEVLTAESLFSSLLDRVRNLTKRLNKEDSVGPSWQSSGAESPGFGLWNSGPLREFMASSAPLEAKQFLSYSPGTTTQTVTRSYSREPSVTVTITTGPGWRRSLSRDVSNDSSDMSESKVGSAAATHTTRHRPSLGNSSDGYETSSVRSMPTNLGSLNRRASPFGFSSQKSEPAGSTYGSSATRPAYGRTTSNVDYTTSVTLPLPFQRRSLRAYDRNLTGGLGDSSSVDRDPIHSYRGMTPRLSNDPSRFEPSRFEPGSPYLARLQSLNRGSTPDPDGRRFGTGRVSPNPFSSSTPSSFLASRVGSSAGNTNSGESNGWVGGYTSSGAEATTPSAPLTTQEKMNNYQNYYRSLSETPAPLRRFCAINNPAAAPSPPPQYMVARPTTMYETSFVNLDNGDPQNFIRNDSVASSSMNNNVENYVSPNGPSLPYTPTPNSAPKAYSTKSLERNPSQTFGQTPIGFKQNPTNESDAGNMSSSKWPSSSVNVSQHRPVSISSFPKQNCIGPRSPEPFVPPSSAPRVASPPPLRESSVEPGFGPRRPLSPPPPPEKGRFVRAQTERLTSPPPESAPMNTSKPTGPSSGKFKRDSRATSVEKITRLLERKSVPREIPPSEPVFVRPKSPDPVEVRPPPIPVDTDNMNSLDKSSKANSSGTKLAKPKFIQSLEKKWGKLTNKPEESSNPSPPPNVSSSAVESTDVSASPIPVPSNESELLQRAVSPEKKPKSKFGASTVNFMLGKFRKIEESSSGPNVAKVPFGKPPIGSAKVGRRVQSVYAGAASDSVVTLSAPPQHRNYAEVKQKLQTELSDDSRSGSNVTLCEVEQAPTSLPPITTPPPPIPPVAEMSPTPETKKPRRPLSLGIFSKNSESSKSASFIPRMSTPTPPMTNGKSTKPVEPPQPVSPQIRVDCDPDPVTPTSDSLDSPTSGCSEKTEVSAKSSALDDMEESVSDRIFRKSFYSRFNSLDRKKYGSSSGGTSTSNSGRNRSMTTALPSSKALDAKTSSASNLSPKINKYNPNPLFRELITDEFKSNAGSRSEYSRRATSKLSSLLREIEGDMKVPSPNGDDLRKSTSPTPTTNGTSAKAGHHSPNHMTDGN